MRTLIYQYSIVEVFSIFDNFIKPINLKPKYGKKTKLNLIETATISLIRFRFNKISEEELKDVEWKLNNRPRKRLNFILKHQWRCLTKT